MAFVIHIPLSHQYNKNKIQLKSSRHTQPTTAILDRPASNPHLRKVSSGIVRDFLTRRAVHTMVYYLQEMRDSASTNWLLNFENFENAEKEDMFHDGEGFLSRMLKQPQIQGEYIQHHPRAYLTRHYPFTIRPAGIARSILVCRKQLANEWAIDLRCVNSENLEMRKMFFERLVEADEGELSRRRNRFFDFDGFESDQTPMRSCNLEKLSVLVTQHAIARLMVYLRDSSNHDYMFLYNFTARFGALCDGAEYIQKLMMQPAMRRKNPKHIVDPSVLANHIMEIRKVIADEWINIMKQIPEEQHALTVSMLRRSASLNYPFSDMDEEVH